MIKRSLKVPNFFSESQIRQGEGSSRVSIPESGGGAVVGGGDHDGDGDESGDELREAEDEAAGGSGHALNILHPRWRSIVSGRSYRNRIHRVNRRSAHVHHTLRQNFRTL